MEAEEETRSACKRVEVRVDNVLMGAARKMGELGLSGC